MHSIFRGWHFMERTNHRRVCFKGSGGGSSEIPETEAQRASAEISMKNYNDYMGTIRPFEGKYIADVTSDVAPKTEAVAGQINADVAQKVGTPAFNPNRGMAGGADILAKTLSSAQVKGRQAVINQKASGMQSVIDMGQGKATQAQAGMSYLAQQSVAEATADAASRQASYDATMNAGATGIGTAAGMAKNFYDDANKKT